MKVKVYVVNFELPSGVKRWALRIGTSGTALLVGGIAFAGLPGGYADGQPLTAAALTANFNYLQNQITTTTFGPRTPSAFHAWLTSTSTTASIPSSTVTTVLFDYVEYDLASEYTASSGAFVAAASGLYLVTCELEYQSPVTGATDWSAVLYKNGMEFGATDLFVQNGSTVGDTPEVSRVVQLAPHDSVTCAGYQESGSPAPLLLSQPARNSFSVTRLY